MAQGTTKGVPIDIDPLLAADSDLLVPSQKAIKTYTDTGLFGKVNKSGDSMSGSLLLVANPTVPLEAATKDYVDTLINGIDWKQAVNASTISALPSYNVTGSGQILTGTVNGAIPSATTDGVALTINQRVLVKNETSTNTPNNGIYTVTQVGNGSLPFILTRTSDANTPTLLAEATVSVAGGSTLSNTQWHCNPASTPITIGSTYITFAQISSGVYTAGSGLSLTGNIFSISSNGVTDAMIQSSSNWNTAYTNRITSLTTTGTSGAATLTGNTLNIPQYTTPTNLSLDDITASGTINILNDNGSGVSIPLANSVGSGIISASNYDKLTALSTSRQIPPLGSTGQVLGKISGTDYAVGWIENVVDGSVTFAKMANISNNTLIGRFTAGTGSPESIGIGSGLSNSGTTLYNTLAVGLGSNQTVIGGLNASGTLTLSSTSNATKGNILFGTSAYDEANDRLGIGTTSPTNTFHISKNITASSGNALIGLVNGTLTASANNDTLNGLNVNLTFSNGAFTGVNNYLQSWSNGGALRSFVRWDGLQQWNMVNASNVNVGRVEYGYPSGNTGMAIFDWDTTNSVYFNRYNIANEGTFFYQGFHNINNLGGMALFNTTHNLVIGYTGTPTDSGFKLDVTGTARASTSLDTPIIRGGTTSGGTLTLSSTSNATKGNILFGNSAYDELNNRLGLGITSPTSKLHVVSGTLTDLVPGMYFSATMPTTITNTNTAVDFQVTSSGSSAFTQRAVNITQLAGFTGAGSSIGLVVENFASGTGAGIVSGILNQGIGGACQGTTVGTNIGFGGVADNGNINIGVRGRAFTAKNNATNIGILGIALNTGTTPIHIAGYFGLQSSAPTFTSAALMADNGATTDPIFVARDNGTPTFTIADGGAVTSTGAITVPDAVYGAGWNGNNTVPTKNAVYDKIESLVVGGGGLSESLAIAYAIAL